MLDVVPLYVGQKRGEKPDQRQERADAVDELDAVASASQPSTAAPRPPMPNAKPKNRPEISPTRPGTSSCA